MYIPKSAYNEINRRLEEGQMYIEAIKHTAFSYGFEPAALREAYDRKLKRDELLFIASNALLALGMVSAFLCPVFFYLAARG